MLTWALISGNVKFHIDAWLVNSLLNYEETRFLMDGYNQFWNLDSLVKQQIKLYLEQKGYAA